jgi:hypothetical protein
MPFGKGLYEWYTLVAATTSKTSASSNFIVIAELPVSRQFPFQPGSIREAGVHS